MQIQLFVVYSRFLSTCVTPSFGTGKSVSHYPPCIFLFAHFPHVLLIHWPALSPGHLPYTCSCCALNTQTAGCSNTLFAQLQILVVYFFIRSPSLFGSKSCSATVACFCFVFSCLPHFFLNHIRPLPHSAAFLSHP